MVLDISGNRLDAKFLRENGATNDYFTILKLNYPPVASNLAANVNGDFSANLALAGGDINRNPISYATVSPPAHGLISNLNPLTGAFTYTPAHGFSGADSFTFQTHDGQTNSSAGQSASGTSPRMSSQSWSMRASSRSGMTRLLTSSAGP